MTDRRHLAPLAAAILAAACASATPHHAPADAGPDPLLHLIGDGTAGAAGEGEPLDAGPLAEGLDAAGDLDAAAGLDGAPLATPDAAGLDVPDAGDLDAATPPAPNACGGLGVIVCARPPCVPGGKCATVTGCAANVCVDCPGADIQCAESQCGGSWVWECAGANVIKCSNGRFSCQ